MSTCNLSRFTASKVLTFNIKKWNIFQYSTASDLPENDLTKSEKVTKYYDIIIAGGGMVGTTLANALSKNTKLDGKSVLLLEGASKFKGFSTEKYSNRVSAISKGSADLLKSIGAWKIITETRFKPVKQMQIWDASSGAMITFNDDNFNDDVAYIIENDLLLDAVYKTMATAENVTIKNNSIIDSCQLPKDGAELSTVTLKSGEIFTCDLLIGADGANSLVRKQMNAETFSLSYNQMGVVATLELDNAGDNNIAWQRFLPTGPVALLPLNSMYSSLVWSTTPNHAKELIKMSADEFANALNEAFIKEYNTIPLIKNVMKTLDSFLGNSSSTGMKLPPKVKSVVDKSRAAFPLGFTHSSSYVGKGVALIGDAAHRIHPLAGQGVNLGFGDVKCLTDTLGQASYSGIHLREIFHLMEYESERLKHNVPIMLGVHGLQRLYGTSLGPFVLLRTLGLQLTQSITPIKRILMDRAMS